MSKALNTVLLILAAICLSVAHVDLPAIKPIKHGLTGLGYLLAVISRGGDFMPAALQAFLYKTGVVPPAAPPIAVVPDAPAAAEKKGTP